MRNKAQNYFTWVILILAVNLMTFVSFGNRADVSIGQHPIQ